MIVLNIIAMVLCLIAAVACAAAGNPGWAAANAVCVFLNLFFVVFWYRRVEYWFSAPERWRHKARGSIYTIVDAQGVVQTSTLLSDYETVVIYRDEKTGRHYVRPLGEFMDGRFERL